MERQAKLRVVISFRRGKKPQFLEELREKGNLDKMEEAFQVEKVKIERGGEEYEFITKT